MIAHGAANGLGHYLVSFIAYTLLTVGGIYAVFLYLKQNPRLLAILSRRPQPGAGRRSPLSVETMLPLEARKSLYIIRSGDERFLIATSPEGTQFLSKLAEETPERNLPEKPSRPDLSPGFPPESVVESKEALNPMYRLIPVVYTLAALKSIRRAGAFVGAKFFPAFRERFERLQYQFEKTSNSHW